MDMDGLTQVDGGLYINLDHSKYIPIFVVPLCFSADLLFTVNLLDTGTKWYLNFKQYQTGEYLNQKHVKARVYYVTQ